MAILGGAAFWQADEDGAGRGLALALERGVNHLDIAPQYGAAEETVGPHLPSVRDRLFIGCKTLRHNAAGVRAQLEESLRRFGTDHVDLYQLHAVTTIAELDRRADALAAIERARDQGLTRYLGITGHDLTVPATMLEALRRFDFDTVMFPIYPRLWSLPEYREPAEELLAMCVERDVGVMAIKAAARRRWDPDADYAPSPWYEPHTEPDAIARGVAFALDTPGVTAFCTPGSAELLPRVLDAADAYAPMTGEQRDQAITAMSAEEPIFPMAG